MKKVMMLVLVSIAASAAFADRTASREWTGRNFAPSNLVPRVEALENAEPPTETDPVFCAWTNRSSFALGNNAYVGSLGTVAIGPETQSLYDRSVALGAQAIATGKQSVQLGGGSNGVQRTLQFLGWQLVDADGKIPIERLPEVEMEESDPDFVAWQNGRRVVAGVSDHHPSVIPASATEDFTIALGGMATNMYCIAIGDKAVAGAMRSVAIGDAAEVMASSSVQLGQGKCTTKGTLQFRFTPILTETKKSIDGKKTYIGTLNEKLVIPQLDTAVSNLTARIEALESRIPEGDTE